MPTIQRAVVVTEFGGPERLTVVEDWPFPKRQPGEVRKGGRTEAWGFGLSLTIAEAILETGRKLQQQLRCGQERLFCE